jgi:hypothetical protein
MKLLKIQRIDDLVLKPINAKFWKADRRMRCGFLTDEGVYLVSIYPEFITDLRSGCALINPVVPKWGTQNYSWSVIGHDVAFHGYLSFDLANNLFLRQGMAVSKQIGPSRANLACNMVNIFGKGSHSDMSEPIKPPYHKNRDYCKIELIDRMPRV